MIQPTIGRVVWFYPKAGMSQPNVALIAHVWSDTCVNLAAFDENGIPFNATSVLLVQDDNPVPDAYYAVWMPYQKGQAAKTEALEKATSAT
jgi:hypothetical protein